MITHVKIYCCGIGGIGLSAYAAYQNASGHTVSGSDIHESAIIDDLRNQGITVFTQHDGPKIPEDTDLFVYTLALPENHPERVRANELNVSTKTYFEALGDLTENHQLICVAGTSGKSSTTSMAAKLLIDSNHDPSVILGTKTQDLVNRNWRKGNSNIFLVEACEYQRSFLNLSPNIVLLTNAYGDHFDSFHSAKDYKNAFQEFLIKIPTNGTVITHLSDPFCADLTKDLSCNIIDTDVKALIDLQIPGRHMQENAQLVLSLADVIGISHAEEMLKEYRGCWRRSEIKGERDEILIIDDYGHHPHEVHVTLDGIKQKYSKRRLVCVFQPHTHDRTAKLYEEFLSAFSSADVVIIPNIYEARSDRDSQKIDIEKFLMDIAKGSITETYFGESFEKTIELLKNNILQKNDILITMGAGDVWKISDAI